MSPTKIADPEAVRPEPAGERESWLPFLGALALTIVVVINAVAFGPGLALRVIHHRDEAAFHKYVSAAVGHRSAGDELDEAWAENHPELILAEGSRACRWLAERPTAPDVDFTGTLTRDRLVALYLRSTKDEPIALVSRVDRWVIVSAAWRYLCWHEQDVHTATFQGRNSNSTGD